MNELEHLIDAITSIEKLEKGNTYLIALNMIAELIREIPSRRSKGKYTNHFDLGKLVIDIKFDGTK